MRRPVTDESASSDTEVSMIDQDTQYKSPTISMSDGNKQSESRFSKVKRILSGTLMIGRSHSKVKRNVNDEEKLSKKSDKFEVMETKTPRKRDHSQDHSLERDGNGISLGLKSTKRIEFDKNASPSRDVHSKSSYESTVIPKSEMNVRKRKERNESTSSTTQERKLIRSNSEERPEIVNKELTEAKDMRRVSSHEDFKKRAVMSEKILSKTEKISFINDENYLTKVQKDSLHEVDVTERCDDINKNNTLVQTKIMDDNAKLLARAENISQDSNDKITSISSDTHYARNWNSPNRISPNRDPRNQFFTEHTVSSDFLSEHEKRRMSERFSRPLAPRGGRRKASSGKPRRSSKEYNRPILSGESESNGIQDSNLESPVQLNIEVVCDKSPAYQNVKMRENSSECYKHEDVNNKHSNLAFDVDIPSTELTYEPKQCDSSVPKIITKYDNGSNDYKEGKKADHSVQKKIGNFIDHLQETYGLHYEIPVSPKSPNKRENHDAHIDKFDFKTLHQQVDSTEPIPICSNYLYSVETMPSQSVMKTTNRDMLSPRNSIIMTRRIYTDPDIHVLEQSTVNLKIQSDNTVSTNPLEMRIKHVSKQINSLKKKIKQFDDSFEIVSGVRASYSDRICDKRVKSWITELNRLKKELKCLKNDPMKTKYSSIGINANIINNEEDISKSRLESIKNTLGDINKRLTEKRQNAKRIEEIEQMSSEELSEEKIAVQKGLLYFESIHGRPIKKEDRDLVRPLYDRYRQLKRLVAKASSTKMNSSASELATILEHETMDFVSLPIQENSEQSETAAPAMAISTDSSDTDTSIGENLHALPLEELIDQHNMIREEKKRLRKMLKDFEHEFQLKTGRRLQKDERTPMESTYVSYKQAKAKLRLLDALVVKHNKSFP